MFKKFIALLLCLFILLTGCSVKAIQKVDETSIDDASLKDVSDLPKVEKVVAKGDLTEHDEFQLNATKTNEQGIDKTSSFVLTSKTNVDVDDLRKSIKIEPETKYEINKISDKKIEIVPASKLDGNSVYRISVNDKETIYSWAFQTKKDLIVVNTVPYNESKWVPVNTGIELSFSLTGIKNIEQYFTIEPSVKGEFKEDNDTIIFIPKESLNEGTQYTITIKKGLELENSDEKLNEDYVFSFVTEGVESQARLDPFCNIYYKNNKFVSGYVSSEILENECTINIFKYNTFEDFERNVHIYQKELCFNEKLLEDTTLSLIKTINETAYTHKYGYREIQLFELPEDLDKGYYLVEVKYPDVDAAYSFVQLNDIMLYTMNTTEKNFVMAVDGADSKGIDSADVFCNGDFIGKTDKDGVLVYDFQIDNKDSQSYTMTVKKDGYNSFILFDNIYYEYNYMGYYNYNYISKYEDALKYFDIDRVKYLPTDRISFWGFLNCRDKETPKHLRADFIDGRTGIVMQSKELSLTDIGTYEGYFEFEDIPTSFCTIHIYDGDDLVSSDYIDIVSYSKPIGRLEGSLTKKYVYSGDDVYYNVSSLFNDGTEYSNLDVMFSTYCYSRYAIENKSQSEEFTTDDNGKYAQLIDTKIKSNSWRPETLNVTCVNDNAEDSQIKCSDFLYVFPKDKMLEIEQNINKEDEFDILFHELVISDKYIESGSFEDLRGAALTDKIHVEIEESYSVLNEVGQEYDYINKVNVKKYERKYIENCVYDSDVNVENGKLTFTIPNYNSDRQYTVTATYEDGIGGIIESQTVGYSIRRYYEEDGYDIETTNLSRDDYKYRVGDNVGFKLKYNDEYVQDTDGDRLVVFMLRNGLIDYKIVDTTQLNQIFKSEYVPNIQLRGLYLKNGYMHDIEYISGLYFDNSQRKIDFEVSTDKKSYKPGDEVTLKIKAFDENKKPVTADINISVVDEAYFDVFPKEVDTLNNIYSYVYNDGIYNTYMSNDGDFRQELGAEKGGCGDESAMYLRDDFKDTSAFKTVTTNKNGEVEYKFKLPDNLTTWRITYQAISDELYAGSGKYNISCSIPYFVDVIAADKYLVDDIPSISIRTFGDNAIAGDSVNYDITVKNKLTNEEKEYSETGKIGEYKNIDFDKLPIGDYELYVYSKSNGNTDGIKKDFSIVESTVYFNNREHYKITQDTVLDKVYSNAVLTLFNESDSMFYNSLNDISNASGRRLDQSVASLLASKYVYDNFQCGENISNEKILSELFKYYNNDNGFKMFTYSKESIELTALIADLCNDEFVDKSISKILNRTLSNSKQYTTDIAAALWGLSNYREPKLLTVYDLLENHDVELRDKIYLSLALAEYGDYENSYKYYKEIYDEHVVVKSDCLYVNGNKNELDSYELTALMAILGCKLSDYENSDNMFKYIYLYPSKYTLSNLEQLAYIKCRNIMELDEIKKLFGEVTVEINGKKNKYTLKLFERAYISIPLEDVENVRFSNINGDVACFVDALGNKDSLEKNKTNRYSFDVSYKPINSSTVSKDTYKQGDIIQVTITPKISSEVEYLFYELTYVVPSNFRYIHVGDGKESYVNQNGQRLTSTYFYWNGSSINGMDNESKLTNAVFYIQAVQEGEYTVDYTVMKDLVGSDLYYVEKNKMVVK